VPVDQTPVEAGVLELTATGKYGKLHPNLRRYFGRFGAFRRLNVESMFLGAKTLVPLLTKAGHANPAGAAIINMCSAGWAGWMISPE